jgi:uncharacterized protein (TIGR02996 family)
MSQREAFLRAIAANEDDFLVRLVFADWLDDHGEHEEAERQRKLPEAKKWLDNVCKEHNAGCREGQEFTYDQLLDFGRNASAMAKVNIEVSDIPNSYNIVTAIRDHIPAFWKNWSIVTGLPLSPNIEQKYYYVSGFCCQNEINADTHVAGPLPEEIIRAEEEQARLQQQLEETEATLRRQQLEEAEEEIRQRGFDRIQDELETDRP